MRSLLLTLLLAGCVHDDLVQCDDGRACPVGLFCDVAHQGCVTQEQLDACVATGDGTSCLEDSTCHEAVCLPNECGNTRVDVGEVCDDGNKNGTDGCASLCNSNERCGNGFLDLALGEACDDGNLLSHDGCDSRCAVERPVWSQIVQVAPPRMSSHAAAYDARRKRLVVFGGTLDPYGISPDTFEYDIDLDVWLRVTPEISPTARSGGAMAYDAERGLVVLFGGYSVANDTWTWDGRHWKDVTPPPLPNGAPTSPPVGGTMVYEASRKRILYYAPAADAFPPTSGATWAWDGTQWTDLGHGEPGPRAGAGMAYDPVHDRVVMYGGWRINTGAINDGTWLWDGSTWTNVADTTPGARGSAAMTFDPLRGGVVLFGAAGTQAGFWDGSHWSVVGPSSTSINVSGAIAYFDATRGGAAFQGGYSDTLGTRSEAFVLTGGNSLDAVPVVAPPADSAGAAMTYDPTRGRIVRFGGDGSPSQTWEMLGSIWTQRSTAAGMTPPARSDAAMTYSPVHGGVLLQAGDKTDPVTWRWNGSAWSQVATNTPLRIYSGLAYSTEAGVPIMFGGDSGGHVDDQTWLLTGTAWEQRTYSSSPNQNAGNRLVYDRDRGVIVDWGGQQQFVETWEWSSSQGWHYRMVPRMPPGRATFGATYDPRRKRVVIFGGSSMQQTFDDAWEYDGTTWTRIEAELRPSARSRVELVYDEVGAQMIMQGPDTWRLQWDSTLPSETCFTGVDRDGDGLTGCNDPDCEAACRSCGDNVCEPSETFHTCPSDCAATLRCGDTFCDPGESSASCPGDCP